MQSKTSPSDQITILIVEDDPVLRTFLEHLLEREGYALIVAEDGLHACTMLSEQDPDMIVSDLQMPKADGFTVLHHVRDVLTRSTPFIFLSGRGQEKDIVKALDEGANDYLVKPFQPEELLARLRRWQRALAK